VQTRGCSLGACFLTSNCMSKIYILNLVFTHGVLGDLAKWSLQIKIVFLLLHSLLFISKGFVFESPRDLCIFFVLSMKIFTPKLGWWCKSSAYFVIWILSSTNQIHPPSEFQASNIFLSPMLSNSSKLWFCTRDSFFMYACLLWTWIHSRNNLIHMC
jgi:hypothetical protein